MSVYGGADHRIFEEGKAEGDRNATARCLKVVEKLQAEAEKLGYRSVGLEKAADRIRNPEEEADHVQEA